MTYEQQIIFFAYTSIKLTANVLLIILLKSEAKHGGPGGSMSQVVGSNNSYKPITNTAWVRAQLCKLQKGCTRLATTSDKVYQLLAQDRWFSPGTPASSTTKPGRHDIAEILIEEALNTKIQIHSKLNTHDRNTSFTFNPAMNSLYLLTQEIS